MRMKGHPVAFLTIVLAICIFSAIPVTASEDMSGTMSSPPLNAGTGGGGTVGPQPLNSLVQSLADYGSYSPVSSELHNTGTGNIRPVPVQFIKNDGQSGAQVKFQVISDRGTTFFTARSVVFAPGNPTGHPAANPVISITFAGAENGTVVEGNVPLPGRVNFLTGAGSQEWHTNVPVYQELKYSGLYPGIDLVYKGIEGAVESEYTISPGADPSKIKLLYSGVDSLSIGPDGSLIITTKTGTLTESAPDAYQVLQGRRVPVHAGFTLLPGNTVGFSTGTYTPTIPLVIDPVMRYGMYLSGTGVADADAVARDDTGNVYIAGKTYPALSMDNSGAVSSSGGTNAIIVKINQDGTSPVYIDFIGGNGDDAAAGIAVQGDGNAYITGSTNSTDFPVVNPLQGSLRGIRNAYIVHLNPSGDGIIYSTYLGGTATDTGNAIAVDSSGDAYITGTTGSADFPVKSVFQRTSITGAQSAFVSKLTSTGKELDYSGYLGGNAPTTGTGIAVDGPGSAYVTGQTFSSDFPVVNAFQNRSGGYGDAYVTKIASDGSMLLYSSYLGGGNEDTGTAIATGPSGEAYITGRTWSANFPVKNAVQPSSGGLYDAFVTRVSPDGSSLVYSTYIGGSGTDQGQGIAVNSAGNAYVTGMTNSQNFPVVNPYQDRYGGGELDAFCIKISDSWKLMDYSTYLGGSGRDQGNAIAVDNEGNAYIVGQTSSRDFPMVDPFPDPGGIAGGFVADLKDEQGPVGPPYADFTSNTTMGADPLDVMFTDLSSGSPDTWLWDFGDGSTSHEQYPVHRYMLPGSYSVTLTVTNAAGSSTITKGQYIQVIGMIGGDKGYYLVHSNIEGASVFFDTSDKGTIINGTLLVQVYVTGTPYRNFTVAKEGYIPLTQALTVHPGKDQTIDLYANLTPVAEPPVADFSGDPLSGDNPLVVKFMDTSTGYPGSWNWSFGDGNYSPEQNPEYEYQSPGVYSVTLTVSNTEGNSTKTRYDYITVAGGPIGGNTGYYLVHSNVDGAAVLFDQTPEGLITNGTLLVQVYVTGTPFQTYTVENSGYQPLTQAITSYPAEGETVDLYANLTPETKPVAGFSANATNGSAPLTVQFYDNSTGSPDTWSWDLGDGLNSTDQNPVHTYSRNGSYSVLLTVENDAGSSTAMQEGYITVSSAGETGFFLVHANLGDAATVPVENATVLFDQTPEGVTGPDGTLLVGVPISGPLFSTFTVKKFGLYQLTQNISTYPATGETVDLYANLTGPKEPVIADFSGQPRTGNAPLAVQFTDHSIGGPDSWYWTFGDGNSSNEENPVDIYGVPGMYNVTLTARNTDTQLNNTRVQDGYITVVQGPDSAPEADFIQSVTAGTAPLEVLFTDNSTGSPTSWQWDFGDGSINATVPDPDHIYVSPGLYNVSMTAANSAGTSTIEKTGLINVSPQKPVASFTLNGTTGEPPLVVQFTDTSLNSPTSWSWDFGDGSPASTEINPVHAYTETGLFTVTLTVENNGGSDSMTALDLINVSLPQPVQPVADFYANTTAGGIPLTVGFTDASSGSVDSWNWAFGDGATSSETNPLHEFTAPGSYTVGLTVSGAGGNDTKTKEQYIHAYQPQTFYIDASAGQNGTITPSGQVPVNIGTTQAFTIEPETGFSILDVMVDGTSAGAVPSYTFTDVISNHTIVASFTEEGRVTHSITAAAGQHGIITPQGIVRVPDGTDKVFIITPDTGYHIADLQVDSVAVPVNSTYEFVNVTSDHVISADFAISAYTINASAGDNGIIIPNGTLDLLYGDSQLFNITPASGFRIQQVLVDGSSAGTQPSYLFSNISANHTIQALFTQDVYFISASSSGPGVIDPTGVIQVNPGQNQVFTMQATTGNVVRNLIVDSYSEGPQTSWEFVNIQQNHSIFASFGPPGGGGGGSGGGGGGGGGGGFIEPVIAGTTTTTVPNVSVEGSSTTDTSNQLSSGRTIPVTQVTQVETPVVTVTTTVPTTIPAVITTIPTAPTPIWAKIPTKYILPIIIIIIVIAIGLAGYYLYRRRQNTDQFFD